MNVDHSKEHAALTEPSQTAEHKSTKSFIASHIGLSLCLYSALTAILAAALSLTAIILSWKYVCQPSLETTTTRTNHQITNFALTQNEMTNNLALLRYIVDWQTAVLNKSLEQLAHQQTNDFALTRNEMTNSLAVLESTLQRHTAELNRSLEQVTCRQTNDFVLIQNGMTNLVLLRSAVEWQTAVLNRSLGQIVPATPRPEWETQLLDIEKEISVTTRWPTTEVTANTLLKKVSLFTKQLTPWGEDYFKSRLNSVRWATIAFQMLYCQSNLTSSSSLGEAADQIKQFIDDRPDGVSGILCGLLDMKVANLEKQANTQELREFSLQGEKYLTLLAIETNVVLVDDKEIVTLCANLEMCSANDQGARKLRDNLLAAMASQQEARHNSLLKDRWKKLKVLKDKEPLLYQACVPSFYNELLTERVSLSFDGRTNSDLNAIADEIHHAITTLSDENTRQQENTNAKAMKKYQRWALTSITTFRDAYNGVAQDASKASKLFKIDNSGWNAERYSAVADLMVEHLLEINIGLLEMPLQELYSREFQRGWTRLDGTKYQTEVAERTVNANKKSLLEFLAEEAPR